MDVETSILTASGQTEEFNRSEPSVLKINRKTCVENKGVQTDDTIEVNVFPRSTQTESFVVQEQSTGAQMTDSAFCQTDHEETNNIFTQTNSEEIDEIRMQKPNNCNEPLPSQSTQTEFLTVKGYEKRHQFLLPNLISGTLLALAGIRKFQIDHQYRYMFLLMLQFADLWHYCSNFLTLLI